MSPPLLVATLGAGGYHSCMIKNDGGLTCWGLNDERIIPPEGRFTQLSVGWDHTCALRTDAALLCWGRTGKDPSVPMIGSIFQLGAGNGYTCVLKFDGTVTCWGDSLLAPPPGTFTQISTGWHHACGIRTDGTVTCWGNDDYQQASPPEGTFLQVNANGYHSCGIKPDSTVVCWGNTSRTPAEPPTEAITQVAVGFWYTCGIKHDGTVACWGENNHSQTVPPPGTFVQISAGYQHACGLKNDGTVACWGDNGKEQVLPPHELTTHCAYHLDSSDFSYSATASTGTVTVTASADFCTWTASSQTDWLRITAIETGSGLADFEGLPTLKGNGLLTYTVATNSSEQFRVGQLLIAGQPVTISQWSNATLPVAPQKAFSMPIPTEQITTESLPLRVQSFSDQFQSQTFPVTLSKHIYGLSITGQFQLPTGAITATGGLEQFETDPAALVRVVLVDNDTQAEYLVYEKSLHTLTSEEAASSLSLYFDKVCEETCILPRPLNTFSLRLSVRQAALSIAKISYANSPMVADREALRAEQEATKIWQLNEQNLGWIAGETAVSKLSYAEKKRLFGTVADLGELNLQGLEHYRGGIFQLNPKAVSTRSKIRQTHDHSLIKNFNWADKHHGKDCWVTSVKNQNCKNDWAFGSVGALEAVANLYFNQCLNLDLAEEATLSCSGAGNCAGGVATGALDYFQTIGIVEEACFPLSDTAPQCQDQCSKPQELIQTSGKLPIDSPEFPRTEEAIKRLLIENGPMTASINSLGQVMTLVGFKEDPLDGQTIWIFKNSWGTQWGATAGGLYYGSEWGEYGSEDGTSVAGENGYVYLKLQIDDFGSDTNVIKTPILSQVQLYEIRCEDVDHDGYCNWGISKDQPDTCPASCKPTKDCDDSNPELTTFDINYHCTGNQLPSAPPIARFTATPQKGLLPLEVTLDASGSYATEGALATYEWTIDGQPVEFNDSLLYTFEKPGQFEVTLTVTDQQGLTATTKKMITVVNKYPPVANFTLSPTDTGEVPFKVTLNARSSYDPDGNLISYLWSSSEGHTATGPTATITFTLPGIYHITLTVTDNDNLTGQFQRDLLTIVKQYPPVAKFTVSPANTGEVPFKVTLNAKNSYDPDGEIINYHWQSSDGQTATGQKAVMTFTQPSSYTITLTVTDNNQLTGQLQQEVVTMVKQLLPPTAQFSLTPAKTGEVPFKVTLNAKDSADPDGDIMNYQWSSSDGQTASGQIATMTFVQPGSYTISLIVTDDNNLTGEVQQEVLVKTKQYPPVAHFTLSPDNTGEVPFQVLLNANKSADPDGHIVMYQWFSSDGQTASGENAILTFTQPGSHLITLTVTDSDNLTSEMQQEVIAKAKPNPPVADFTLSPANRGEAPFTVTLDAKWSSDSDGQIVDYQWQSSDGQTATGPTAVLTFQRPGSYTMTLTVTDNDNLTQSVETEIIVTAPPRREGECFYTITPTIMVHSAEPETGTFTVTAPPQGAWTVTNYAWWLTITAGESGQGDGTITYSVGGNHNTCTVCAGPFLPPDQRSTTLTIASETVTVVQKGETDNQVEVADCTYTISPTTVFHSAEIETGIITVTAPGNCPWTAISNHRWIKITSGENGQGNGTVTYSVESNDNFCTVCTGPFLPPSERSGTLTIAGQTVTIHQGMGVNNQATEEFETLATSEVEQQALAVGNLKPLAASDLERVTIDSEIGNLQPAVVTANPIVSQTLYQLGDTLRVTLPTVPAGHEQYVGISYPNGTIELLSQFNSFIPFDHLTFPVWSGGDVAIDKPVTADLPSGIYTMYLLRMPTGINPLSMKIANWALGVTVFTIIGSH